MSDSHPDRSALERYARGEIAGSEQNWIEDHLRSGCVICQYSVDDLLPRVEEDCLLLPGSGAGGLLELDELDEEDAAWNRLFVKIEHRLAQIASERSAAPHLVAELLRRPAAERRDHLRSASRRLATLAVCEQLIDRSFKEGFRSPAFAIELAELAIEVAERLDTHYYGYSVVQDLRARAWAYLGNARRLASDLNGAEQALDLAERLAQAGSADPLEEALILDLKASLLSDQGWLEEAAELLDIVIEIYDDVRDLHRKGRALISKGLVLGYAGWPQRAIDLIPEALSLIDWEQEPRLVLMARHNLIGFLNDCNRSEEALRQLELFRITYQQDATDPGTDLRLLWLEGRIAAGLKRWSEAERALEDVRRRLVAQGDAYDASMAMLDLANVYLQQGRPADVRELVEEMLPIFLTENVHRQAVAALVLFQQAAEGDQATPALVQQISSFLQRARRNPRLSFQVAA